MDTNNPPATIPKVNTEITQAVGNAVETGSQNVSNIASNVSDSVNNASDYVKESISSFGDSNLVGSNTSFLESNTLIAKFAFLIFVLIIFMILLSLGVKIIGYFMKPNNEPKLINGTMNGSNEVTIYQDPKNGDSIPILRSNNQNKGIEFTWSVWIYINDINKNTKYSHIFNKGNATFDDSGMATVNNGPGLYLDNETNNLVIAMNTVSLSNKQELLNVKNIPLRKWVNCVIRIENTALDVYINGGIVARTVLQDVPKQNYQNVNICKNSGFNGNLADLQYFDKSLSIFQINNIVSRGRNTRAATEGSSNDATGFPHYLSNLWYSANY